MMSLLRHLKLPACHSGAAFVGELDGVLQQFQREMWAA